MKLFTDKAADLKGWQFMLVIFLLGVAFVFVGLWLYDMVYTKNVVVTANNGSFIVNSMGALSSKDRQAAIDNYNKSVADKDKAAAGTK